MKLTALEIKQQKFEKTFRGYDPAEVNNFLKLMSNEWEHSTAKNRELQQQIDDLQEKIKHYERVEGALHETLQAAKETADTKLIGARKEAKHTIEKAELEAESILRDAKVERQKVRQGIRQLLDRRKEIIAGLQSYLQVARESVDQYKENETKLYAFPENEEQETPPTEETPKKDKAEESEKAPSEPKRVKEEKFSASGPENIDELVDGLE